jgi:lipoyl-dependent peroxiredoxin
MKEIKRFARAHWAGDLLHGKGMTSTQSNVLDGTFFSVPSRFENGTGTNPEELIAAAQASCFSMMLAKILGDQHQSIDEINTKATLTLRQDNGHTKISELHLETEAKVAGIDAESFRKAAEEAKNTCPVSMLLQPGLEKVTLDAKLI